MRRIAPLLILPLFVLLPVRADALTVRDIVELTHAGLGDEVLLALIEVDRSVFPIDSASIKQLKADGVSERVIVAMVRSGREAPPPPEQFPSDAAVAAALPPPPEPQVVVIDHHDAPVVREVQVAVPVYIPVATRSVHARAVEGSSNGIPVSSDRWIAEHSPQQSAPRQHAEPVYWGFGGKLRPDAWKPAPDPTVKHKQN
jgi:hypothetical protein